MVAAVSRVMSRQLVFVDPRTGAELAKAIAAANEVHHLLVAGDGELLGVVCLCDLAKAGPSDSVSRWMRAPAVCIGLSDTTEEAAQIMMQCGVGCLPVVADDGTLMGVVTRRDLRRTGTLPGERGVDRCVGCGTSHGLRPSTHENEPVQCFTCFARAHQPQPAAMPTVELHGLEIEEERVA